MRLPRSWKDRAAMVATILGILALAGWVHRAGTWTRQVLVGNAIHDSLGVHLQNYHRRDP